MHMGSRRRERVLLVLFMAVERRYKHPSFSVTSF